MKLTVWSGNCALHRTASSDAAVPSQCFPIPGHAVSSGVQSSWRSRFRDRAHPGVLVRGQWADMPLDHTEWHTPCRIMAIPVIGKENIVDQLIPVIHLIVGLASEAGTLAFSSDPFICLQDMHAPHSEYARVLARRATILNIYHSGPLYWGVRRDKCSSSLIYMVTGSDFNPAMIILVDRWFICAQSRMGSEPRPSWRAKHLTVPYTLPCTRTYGGCKKSEKGAKYPYIFGGTVVPPY